MSGAAYADGTNARIGDFVRGYAPRVAYELTGEVVYVGEVAAVSLGIAGVRVQQPMFGQLGGHGYVVHGVLLEPCVVYANAKTFVKVNR